MMMMMVMVMMCLKLEQNAYDENLSPRFTVMPLHFNQCPFPNQIQFGLEKLYPKIAYNFPNQFQFGLERKKLILQDSDSKPYLD